MAEAKTGWSDGQKWFAGVAATVVGALLVWGATHEGGWFNPKPTPTPAPPAEAVISLSEFDAPIFLNNDENGTASFTIANEGEAVARGCVMRGNTSPALGEEFSVQPHSSTKVSWGLRSYGLDPGSYDFKVWVECQNAASSEETKTIPVV